MSKITRQLRKLADHLEYPEYSDSRRLRIPIRQYQFFRRLQQYQIDCILDIGANTGEYARWCATAFPGVPVHCFEPLPQCADALTALAAKHSQVSIHRYALGDQEATCPMFENEYAPSSSILPMLNRHRELWPKTCKDHSISVPVHTLDNIMAGVDAYQRIFMKMDVQGYEMHVLRGAESTLHRVQAIQMEVLFEDLYDGQSNLRSFMNHLADRGFVFSEFMDERRLPPSQTLIYADAVFIRTASRF